MKAHEELFQLIVPLSTAASAIEQEEIAQPLSALRTAEIGRAHV